MMRLLLLLLVYQRFIQMNSQCFRVENVAPNIVLELELDQHRTQVNKYYIAANK